jgi:DNA-directed RNA polymerase subunit RPC12/RpoP
MSVEYKYCRKCKKTWNPHLHDSDSECPHCGHRMTFKESFETQFFGQMGLKGCGCLILLVILVIILLPFLGKS